MATPPMASAPTGRLSRRGAQPKMGFDLTRNLIPQGRPQATSPWALIVCERSGFWASRLRDVSEDDLTPICETRSARECLDVLERHRTSGCLVEMMSDNVETMLELLVSLSRDFPQVAAVVVAERGLEPLESLTRELGAVHFVVAARNLGTVADTLFRHREAAPPPGGTLVERILETLPWKRD